MSALRFTNLRNARLNLGVKTSGLMLLARAKTGAMLQPHPLLTDAEIYLPGNQQGSVGHPQLFLHGDFRGGDFAEF